ncbi:glycosyl transferase family 1 [Hydrogenophaga crassostreae]|uniref:Glycosyl transferase family 1 n=1 Tax=Hydrogenophaga crassostreae TaxID=1763535 RepID=A0A167ITL8_9BURK|nr:selenoneine biosynthesis selenosugar synthase SenB [Hydrogenophaga crassostreae]AOW14404.1 glycosyl transferase family 1 [Hydrogenophaga crassostreae]OAD43571.1 glycosyl transferase family 1 [Hydrogenophaga crassostreae]
MKPLPLLCLVTPALADANNGNWQTARRWARMLSGHYRVRLVQSWSGHSPEDLADDGLLALHARRSADSVAAWAAQCPGKPLALALTGTDLYRDIQTDGSAQRSLQLAQRLIVLQDQGPLALPAGLRDRCRVVLQSSTRRQTLDKSELHLRAVMVGHLREEKSPQTLFDAARLLRADEGILLDHIGRALDPVLDQAARATMADCPHYRWLGGLAHGATRQRIQRAHVLVHPSRMEGGAHVIMEAALSGTPVLASRVAGNLGMLGGDYAGYFEAGDAAGLVRLLRACRKDMAKPRGLLARLQSQCEARAALFEPAAEKAALLQALSGLSWPPASSLL